MSGRSTEPVGFALTDRSRRFSVWLAIIYMLAGVSLCIWLFGAGLASPYTYLELFDSKGYFSLGEQIYGPEQIDGSRLAQRGYLYPTIAWSALKLHPLVLYAIQLLAVGIGVLALARSEALLTGKIYLTPLVLLIPSLMLAPARMMTEAITFGLLSMSVLLLLGKEDRVSKVVPLIWIGVLIKPSLLLCALVVTSTVVFSRCLNWRHFSLAAILVVTQLVLSAVHDGRPALSNSGAENFAERFHPAVLGWSETGAFVPYSTPEAKAYRASSKMMNSKIRDLLEHPVETLQVWGWLLVNEHLLTKTGYLPKNSDQVPIEKSELVRGFSGWVNFLMLPVWFLGILGCLAAFKLRSLFITSAALAGPLCIAFAPLVYWQGDRVVFFALLTLLPFAALALHRIFSD